MRAALAAILLIVPLAWGQTVRARQRGGGPGLRATSGAFDVRVYVDGEVDLMIRGEEIHSEVFTGRPIRDAGSEFTQPLPATELTRFEIEKKDGRGEVELIEEPGRRNRYTARIRVLDRKGGEDRYHIRILWEGQESFASRSNPRDPRYSTWRPRRGNYSLPGLPLSSAGNNPSAYDNALEGRFEFQGRIDDEVVFYIRGDQITAEVMRGRNVQVQRVRFSQPLPGRALRSVDLTKRGGRGLVELLEEPDRSNGWTAVVRVYDDSGGDDSYRFELIWRR